MRKINKLPIIAIDFIDKLRKEKIESMRNRNEIRITSMSDVSSFIESNNLDGVAYVDGLPNNGVMALEQALSPELDTRKKCSKCGKVFAPREGLYNFPSGALCVKCHKSKK